MTRESKTCFECKKVLVGRQKRFCCNTCKRRVAGRAPGPKKHINCICGYCGINYTLRPSMARKSKYCSKMCQGRGVYAKRLERKGAA